MVIREYLYARETKKNWLLAAEMTRWMRARVKRTRMREAKQSDWFMAKSNLYPKMNQNNYSTCPRLLCGANLILIHGRIKSIESVS